MKEGNIILKDSSYWHLGISNYGTWTIGISINGPFKKGIFSIGHFGSFPFQLLKISLDLEVCWSLVENGIFSRFIIPFPLSKYSIYDSIFFSYIYLLLLNLNRSVICVRRFSVQKDVPSMGVFDGIAHIGGMC